ncbi:MAG: PKD domain-containing protein, partial [Bacteroidota bacterium]
MIRRSIYIFLAAICCPFLLLSQTANIAASVQSGCSPLVVNFDGTASTGNGLSYDWDFGNGNTTSGTNQQAPGAVYVTPGTYTASLIVTDANGNVSAPATQTIVVFDNPTADFAVSDTFGCPPLTVNFTDQSIPAGAPIASWTWDFGDGNSATQANPTHIYDEGSFDAALIVVDANGCQSVVLKTDLIETYPKTSLILSTNGPRQTCNASLTVSFHPVTLGQSAGPFLFDWDFGDGNTGTGPHPNHTYNGAGNYDVTVTITDQSNGCQFVHVEPDFVRLIQNDVSFTISDSGGCAPVTVQFTNTTALLEQDFIATWYFGNGDSLSGSATAPGILSPGYTYTNQGSYDVRLKIDMGPDLCVEEFIWPAAVVVTPEPVVDFTASDTVACAPPLTVNFQRSWPDTQFLETGRRCGKASHSDPVMCGTLEPHRPGCERCAISRTSRSGEATRREWKVVVLRPLQRDTQTRQSFTAVEKTSENTCRSRAGRRGGRGPREKRRGRERNRDGAGR